MRIGVDTGGTFTDVIALADDGRLHMVKVPSTPDDPSRAIVDGLRRLALAPGFEVVHGTTVATNALLERRGAKTALITTQGCRDVLEIARQNREELYSLSPKPRKPLIPRDLRFEVPERLDWRGEVVTPLDVHALESVLDEIQEVGVESVAVCFLFSFLPSCFRTGKRINDRSDLIYQLIHHPISVFFKLFFFLQKELLKEE